MGNRLAEEYLRVGYGRQSLQYRKDDEIEVTTEHHRHLRETLRQLTLAFDRPIRALDAGCGTGRYFHCLQNVEDLVGVDLCPEMLAAAKSPVHKDHISASRIELVCGSIFEVSFSPATFDFIYSLGMFALGCPLTIELCEKFYTWLTPGGKLFFNVTDRAGLPFPTRARRRTRKLVYQFLPSTIQQRWDERANHVSVCELTISELRKLMRQTSFSQFRVTSHPCQSPLWKGSHLECLAQK